MYLLLLTVAAALAHPQSKVDENALLLEIFGTPPPQQGSTTLGLEDYTIRSTDATSTFTDGAGESCQCVPYYLCDDQLIGVDVNNASVTGWGSLDIRFGKDDCQESVERCCKVPHTGPAPTPPPTPAPPVGCGHRNRKGIDFNVIGGSGAEAQFGEFPWVVALMGPQGYIGVGSLIHPQVVITAAHVVAGQAPGSLRIRAGEWDTQTAKERLPHQERDVAEIYIHSDFQSKNLKNDMALLRLSQPVELAEHIGLLCLPEQGESFESSRECVANGWGKHVFGQKGRYAVILKKVELPIVPHGICNQLLQRTRLGHRFRLHQSFVCAGGEEGQDTCKGDGGAPLACPMGNDRYKLTGLVAWGIGCGARDVPAVYAAAAMFRRWVDDKMAAWGFDTSTYSA
ncbi:phenoloxidase-activating factor 2-like [Leguminivora glycinivorella]|uniref:phenoloxidase-activating factor 2-like n=1 Tax=Leguminivora glycinivorella TaxID=1035111 RepID=UPI00200CC613|nr:phenoloxidase-activating factor 2-like [Leguminivora glycinivorella]